MAGRPGARPGDTADITRQRRRAGLFRGGKGRSWHFDALAPAPLVRLPAADGCDDPEFHYRLGIEVFIAGVEAIAARLSIGPGPG